MSSFLPNPDAGQRGELTVAVVSPDRQRRIAATVALGQCSNVQILEFLDYPSGIEEASRQFQCGFDVILIDLDGNAQHALQLVEGLCVASSAIVMVFSEHADPELMLSSLRAGAREFFTLPFVPATIAKALLWVSAHRQPVPIAKKAEGRLLVFFGSKGGVGVTILASNFAVALAGVSGQSTLLIDLNFHLGDAALNLGIAPTTSVLDALQEPGRLDAALLDKFVVQHASGLSILSAPAEISANQAPFMAIEKLIAVARQKFNFVVVDAGKKTDLKELCLFEEFSTAFLVTQVGIPELRNANRIVAQFAHDRAPALEIVVNRHEANFLGFTDEQLTKALTRPVAWKIPNDFKSVRQMQSSTIPLVSQDSAIARSIQQMARSIFSGSDHSADASSRTNSFGGIRLPWRSANKSRTNEPAPMIGTRSAHPAYYAPPAAPGR